MDRRSPLNGYQGARNDIDELRSSQQYVTVLVYFDQFLLARYRCSPLARPDREWLQAPGAGRASIVEKVFKENPSIRARRTSSFTRLTIPITRRSPRRPRAYGGIAPSAAHALHMPSHIFVQRGMSKDVRESNIVGYKAAAELNARMELAEGPRGFPHARLAAVRELMLGNIDEAKAERRVREAGGGPQSLPTAAFATAT